MREIFVGRAGVTLNLLLWQAYGRAGDTAALLRLAQRANPGLAARGVVIAIGTTVRLPDLPAGAAQATRKVVNLFDD